MMRSGAVAAIAALAMLAGCGGDEGAGGVTAEEARQLNEAAEMLDNGNVDASPDSLTVVGNDVENEASSGDLPVSDDTGNGQ